MDLIKLSTIAIKAAKAAGKIIQDHMGKDIQAVKKEAGNSLASQVVTEVDKKCEETILTLLLPSCTEFDIALLSEETEDDNSRFVKDYFWCIDPIDGTLPFINKRPGFSVSIALIAKDGTPCIGVVFDPSTDTLYHAIKGHGTYKNGNPWDIVNTNKHLSYVTDQKLKDTAHFDIIENHLSEKVKELGLSGIKEISGAGSVLNAILVLENGPALMMKLPKEQKGGGSLWDFGATACLFNELGLTATDYHGNRLDLNREKDCFMNQHGVHFSNF